MGEGEAVIRQAISCDICGAEKRQTNHWFIASEQAGELRVSGWNPRSRMRAGAKHLCGQACLHKLADDFMERLISRRIQSGAPEEHFVPTATDTSLTNVKDGNNFDSCARVIPSPALARPTPRPAAALVSMPERVSAEPAILLAESATLLQEPPRYASRSWHAEAWQRERERALQAFDSHPDIITRHISQA
jgi:hypothetical protein